MGLLLILSRVSVKKPNGLNKRMKFFQSFTKKELTELLLPLSAGQTDRAQTTARFRSQQIFHWVYQRFIVEWDQMSDLSKSLRAWLRENLQIFQLPQAAETLSGDGTSKFLWTLKDQKTIESVLIPKWEDSGVLSRQEGGATTGHRLTACISSQVGCAMACKFCLTGIQGLDRNLQTHEIISQVIELRKKAVVTNIVFMGMGEPLHNLKSVIQACKILVDQDGFGFSKRKVTVSTSGLVPGIQKLGEQIDVSLAVSLNATTDEQRDQIMPVNKKWNIPLLLKACRQFPLGNHRRITFEYVLLKDFNDTLEDARRLVQLTNGVRCKINLIPFNEHSGSSFRRPENHVVSAFQKYLLDRNLTATVRRSRGQEILAACGQLRSQFGTARGTERHKDWVKPSEVGSKVSTGKLS